MYLGYCKGSISTTDVESDLRSVLVILGCKPRLFVKKRSNQERFDNALQGVLLIDDEVTYM